MPMKLEGPVKDSYPGVTAARTVPQTPSSRHAFPQAVEDLQRKETQPPSGSRHTAGPPRQLGP